MRIFSKKSLQFDHPAGSEPPVVVRALDFADVPAWVAKSQMFQWAKADGDVEVTSSRSQEKAAEKAADNGGNAGDKTPPAE